ncbi:coproporphyrinogen III oxidase family protein [Paenibacillaceae bacterium]|nr:coproporphyrinogen III oxidase family protein [Paenibacillaceae bacterium]
MALSNPGPNSAVTADNCGDQTELEQWKQRLTAAPYRAYLYSYPHKTAYRELEPPLPLQSLWEHEPVDSYFLYMHIPFCSARCGFCNLFTLPGNNGNLHESYVDALERQAHQWAQLLPAKPTARFAIGGGTPTLLDEPLLARLFTIAESSFGLDPARASISVETSPDTVTDGRLRLLRELGVDRISMGIQSFIEQEAAAIYRPQKPQEVERALGLLRKYDFPLLNLDLIYGLPGQTEASWLYSLERALSYEPGEIFIYPLYTREHTIVTPETIAKQGEDQRLRLYRAARDVLRAHGYTQYSMRRFAKDDANGKRQSKTLLPYSCQEEGMVGLGSGARSYTRNVHYASRYGVSYKATKSIIADYVASEQYTHADYGYRLNESEQKRRYVIKGILHREGLELAAYEERFGTDAREDVRELSWLLAIAFAELRDGIIRLTDEGLAYSDAIGDELISTGVRELMEGFVVL